MMKNPGIRRIVLSVVLFFTFSGVAFSQCNAQWVDSGFVYPFTYLFPCAEQTVAFNSSFQVNMPNMFHGTILLDSIFIDSITGLPAGITWTSSPSPLTLYGDSSGCITLSGTAIASAGTYNLNFFCHAVVTSQGAGTQDLSYNQLLAVGDAPIPAFSMQVIDSGGLCEPLDSLDSLYDILGISELSNTSIIHVFPNPLKTGNWQVTTSNDVIGSEAELFDTEGRLLFSTIIRRNNFTVSPDNFAAGVYLLRIHSSNYSIVNKLLKL
jgi:hypothetical protein